MIGIIVTVVIFVCVTWLVWHNMWCADWFDVCMALGVGVIAALVVGLPVTSWTGGLLPEYSTGFRDGYITKMSHTGLFVKTWEGQMQVGTGNQTTLQEPFKFSFVDMGVREELEMAAEGGLRVRLAYDQFFIKDYRKGGTSYIVSSVTLLGKDE